MKFKIVFPLVALSAVLALSGCVAEKPTPQKTDVQKEDMKTDVEDKKDDVEVIDKDTVKDTEDVEKVFSYENASFLPSSKNVYTYENYESGQKYKVSYKSSTDLESIENEFLIVNDPASQYEDYVFETKEGLFFTIGMEYTAAIEYPIEEGKEWVGYGGDPTFKIEAINQKVETPFQTFENAIKISRTDGFFAYYVPGIGNVQYGAILDDGTEQINGNMIDISMIEE